jgi:formiminotetrahydrofolate cyclodeaminase
VVRANDYNLWEFLGVMPDDTKTVGGVVAAALPAVVSAGLFAIGVLLVNLQVSQARIEASVQSTASAIQDLKNDARSELAELDKRVRILEIKP